MTELPIPIDCVDGFVEAFYARPEAPLDPAVRRSQSCWAFAEPATVERGLAACVTIWPPASGTRATATCAPSRSSSGRCG